MSVFIYEPANQPSIPLTGITAGAWFDIDVSSLLSYPSNYTPGVPSGIMIHLVTSTIGSRFRFRKKGLLAGNFPVMTDGGAGYAYVGIDGNKKFQVWVDDITKLPTFRLIGHFEEESVFFNSIPSFSMAGMANNAWNDVDTSAVVPAGAKAAIFCITYPDVPIASETVTFGARKKGSTWNLPDANNYGYIAGSQNGPVYIDTFHIVPIDVNRKFQVYCQAGTSGTRGTILLIGYIAEGITTKDTPANFTKAPDTTNFYGKTLTGQRGGFLINRGSGSLNAYKENGVIRYAINAYMVPIKGLPIDGSTNSTTALQWASIATTADVGEYILLDPYAIKPPLKALTLSGKVPTVQTTITESPPLKALTLSGKLPVVSTGARDNSPAGGLSFSGQIPAITAAIPATIINSPAKSLTLAGQVPKVSIGVLVLPGLGTLLIEGQGTEVGQGALIQSPLGALVLTNIPVAYGGAQTLIQPPLGQMSVTGLPTEVGHGVVIFPDTASLVFKTPTPNVRAKPRSWIAALNGRKIEEVYVILLTISHPNLTEDILVASDNRDKLSTDVRGVISQEKEFIFVPFRIVLPNVERDTLPISKLSVDNISEEIVAKLSGLSSPPSIKIQVVLSTDPSQVEYNLEGLKLTNATFDEVTIEGDFSAEYYLREPYGSVRFTPYRFPGLYRGRRVNQSA